MIKEYFRKLETTIKLIGGEDMSFLLIRGKMFHCRVCFSSFVLEFDGGAQQAQIDEEDFYNQIQLHKRFMPLTYNFEKEGYYFHKYMVCENCKNSF